MITDDVILGKDVAIPQPQLVNLYGCTIGDGCKIASFVEIQRGVVIGNDVKIQSLVFIPSGVTIEDGVFVGPHVCFTNDKNPRAIGRSGKLLDASEWTIVPTLVCKGASIGANSTIICGVTIGEGAMVGAGTLVNKNVAPGLTVFGNPMRIHHSYICELCHKPFISRDKRGVRFCSRKCYKLAWSDVDKKQELGLVEKDYLIKAKYKEYQNNCERRALEFSLTFPEFKSMWQKPCFYCGKQIESIGIDRVDNEGAYSPSNVVPCCWTCNRMKSKMSQSEFIEHIKYIYKNM